MTHAVSHTLYSRWTRHEWLNVSCPAPSPSPTVSFSYTLLIVLGKMIWKKNESLVVFVPKYQSSPSLIGMFSIGKIPAAHILNWSTALLGAYLQVSVMSVRAFQALFDGFFFLPIWCFLVLAESFLPSYDALVCFGQSIRFFQLLSLQQECERPESIVRKAYLSVLLSKYGMWFARISLCRPSVSAPRGELPTSVWGNIRLCCMKTVCMRWRRLQRNISRWCCNRLLRVVCGL